MTIEQLELMLFYFYNDRKWYKYPDDINSYFKNENFTKPELQAMVQKLVKDGYLIEEEIERTTVSYQKQEKKKVHGWYISYDGVFLIDTLPKKYKGKPYKYLKDVEAKKKRREVMESFPKVYWWAIAIATGLIGFFGTILRDRLLKPDQSQTITVPKEIFSHKTKWNVTIDTVK